ncbi:unnamed protein product [Chondrus crispus]|uniref:Alpha-type protein kinase domain-containing protein n=1 Tax=Chondrus crispus TaxID=2769 RepID=R7QV13_CHOCR|nr:unnamed protein product [Chondrus crispus]CDF41321.1 unnamed protein product [Chondrus crispus]|eukprot:XP_005711615.1 unnamed protein product [Chondrus crispus]
MDSASIVFALPPTSCAQGEIIRDGYNLIVDVLREPLRELHCAADITPQYFVIFDVFPFSAGAQRLAFKGSIYERVASGDPVFCVHAIVKMEMAIPEVVETMETERTRINATEAQKTVRKHDVTRQYIEKWCALGINKSVHVLSTEKVTITRGCSLQNIDRRRFPILHQLFKKLSLDAVLYKNAVGTVEDYLPGRFTKFLNNDGMANNEVSANFPAAFSHWSWVESKGALMVSDIQGVRTGAGYALTDPCIHSVRDREGYGISDLGMTGVEHFFKRHRCNALCNDLGLGKDDADIDLGHGMRTRILPNAAWFGGHMEQQNERRHAVAGSPIGTMEGKTRMKLHAGRDCEVMESEGTDESGSKVRRRSTMRVQTRTRAAADMKQRERRTTIAAGEEAGVEAAKRRRAWGRFWSPSSGGSKKEEDKRIFLRGLFSPRKRVHE